MYREGAYRPIGLEDFIGQDRLKENLKIYMESARQRGVSLDHILLYGPPGLGKTSLAYVIAREMGVKIKGVQAQALERHGDMAAHLTSLKEGEIFFIDELHRLKAGMKELLYSAMEDYKIDIVIGEGMGAKCVSLGLPRYTLIGATTKVGLLSSPFYGRFGIVDRLEYYDEGSLMKLVRQTACLMGMEVDEGSALEIARRSRGTPRVVNRIMRRVRDFVQVEGGGVVSIGVVKLALRRLGIDEEGLDRMDKRLLGLMIEKYKGGPVGLETLAVSLGESSDTIEDIHEPFLIQKGLMMRTLRGRTVTGSGYEYFKKQRE